MTKEDTSERGVVHASFTLERSYPAAPARVFGAWSDPVKKARWFGWPEALQRGEHEFDFRVGGREKASGGPEGGATYAFSSIYQDIVPGQRIIYSYDMLEDDRRMSVSLATIEFLAEGSGTRLVVTEHGTFLDGLDTVDRRRAGTEELLSALGTDLVEHAEGVGR